MCDTPPTRKPPPRRAKCISVTTHCAGLARSGASLGCTGAASSRSVGLASASGSLLKPPYVAPFVVGVADADPLLSEVSSNEEEDEDNASSAIITGNLFARGYGVGGVVMMMFMGGGDEAYKKWFWHNSIFSCDCR